MLTMTPREFAIKTHGTQMYDKDEPYVVHLDEVNKIANDFMPHSWIVNRQDYVVLALMVAYLHDVLEDTDETFIDLELEFGPTIAELVENLTDAEGENRAERKRKTWHKIRRHKVSVYVKLCDRLANTRRAGKIEMYRKEFPLFEAALYVPGLFEDLWDELRKATFGE